MSHTQLTVRSYSSFAATVWLITSVSVGFGAVDLVMVAPKGLVHVAAVGQGELIVAGVNAFFIGVVDVFASRLAIAEGEGARSRRLPALAAALTVLLAMCQLLGLLLVIGIRPLLDVAGQQRALVPLVSDYVSVRGYSVTAAILYIVVSELLKICGMKNRSLAILFLGFAVNAILDWFFLYTGCAALFASPESAVSSATVAAQVLMACCGVWIFLRQMRRQGQRFTRPLRADVAAEFRSMVRTAPGIGARHLNDYAGTIVPMIFIGTLGVPELAAAGVAAKIYTLFCRVPQACASGTFAFYGYSVGRGEPDLARIARRLLMYATIPTAAATLAVLVAAPWMVTMFASRGMDEALARSLVLAFLLAVPAYVLQASYGEMLTVHQRAAFLFGSSSATTYVLTIPFAWYAVFVLRSPFLAIACTGISAAVLALLFWIALRREHRLSMRLAVV